MVRQVILAALQGGVSFSPQARLLIEESRNTSGDHLSLAPRERSVLQLVAEGQTSKQIAERLGIAKKTVDFYRGKLMRKLGVHDVASLTRHANQRGLLAG